jgi:hypothetical protein
MIKIAVLCGDIQRSQATNVQPIGSHYGVIVLKLLSKTFYLIYRASIQVLTIDITSDTTKYL